VTDGLATPIGIVAGDAERLYVIEQGGTIVSIEADGSLRDVVDLSDRISAGGERGLLGLAFHPGWPEVQRAFVHYTDVNGNTVLSEIASRGAEAPTLDPATERILLRVTQPAANHNGGQLAFGPDGYLHMALGDGGGGGDPFGNGQDPGTLLGAILRIDVDGGDPYGTPEDNPFVNGGGAPEVYVYGLRNPWRFSFDVATRDLWIGDVGQGALEEVDRLDSGAIAGENLGWNVTEGAHCYADAGCDPAAYVLPVAEYPTPDGCAVIGGHVYRGNAIAGLYGWYLFADYCNGRLYGVRSDAPPSTDAAAAVRQLLATDLSIASFGQDADGELYIADAAGGAVYRIVAAD
jgi:glucose/arabinose dehydrogenase